MDSKLKHLEMIQAIINRMASNSFLFKGWSITIIAGLTAFAAKDSNRYLIIVSIAATLMFWAVDAYYLMLERAFRDLYKVVAKKDPNKIDLLMDIKNNNFRIWFRTLWRPILFVFYGFSLVLLGITVLIVWRPLWVGKYLLVISTAIL